MDESRSKTRRNIVITAIAALLLAAALAGAWWFFNGGDAWFDPSATSGGYESMSAEEIQDDLDRKVAEGSMNVSIASSITFSDGGVAGIARIENIEENHYDQKVAITLDESGEEIYASGAIAPGQKIDTIEIAHPLSAGAHDATATFTGFDRETHEPVGNIAVQIKLYA